MTVSAEFYTRGAEIAYQRLNCGAAPIVQLYRNSSTKEGPTGLVTQRNVPRMNEPEAFFYPRRLARGAGDLEAN